MGERGLLVLILLLTKKCVQRLLASYEQMPSLRPVIACGNCSPQVRLSRTPNHHCSGVNNVMPVDVFVPGFACTPEAPICAVGMAKKKWRKMSLESKRRRRVRNRIMK
jgi:Ni,Fe-hydrogenase III small subunit